MNSNQDKRSREAQQELQEPNPPKRRRTSIRRSNEDKRSRDSQEVQKPGLSKRRRVSHNDQDQVPAIDRASTSTVQQHIQESATETNGATTTTTPAAQSQTPIVNNESHQPTSDDSESSSGSESGSDSCSEPVSSTGSGENDSENDSNDENDTEKRANDITSPPALNGSANGEAVTTSTTATITASAVMPVNGEREQETVAETVVTATVEETQVQEDPEQHRQITAVVENDLGQVTEKQAEEDQKQARQHDKEQQESTSVVEDDLDFVPLTEQNHQKEQEQHQLTGQQNSLPPTPTTTIRRSTTPPPPSSLPSESLPKMMFARPTQYEQRKCDDAIQVHTDTSKRVASTLRNRFGELLNILNHPDSEVTFDNDGLSDHKEAVKRSGKTLLLFKLLDRIADLQAGLNIAIITENHNTESTICQLLRSHDYRCERIPVILEDNWENDYGVFLSTDKDRTEKWSNRPTIDIVIVFDIRILPSNAIFTKMDGDKRSVWMITKGTIEERAFPILCQGATDIGTDDWKTIWKHNNKLLQDTMYAPNTWVDLEDTEQMTRKSIARAIPFLFSSSLSSSRAKRPAPLESSLRDPKRLCTTTSTITTTTEPTLVDLVVRAHSATTTLPTFTTANKNQTLSMKTSLPDPKPNCTTTTTTSNEKVPLEPSLPDAEHVYITTTAISTKSNNKPSPLPPPLSSTTSTTRTLAIIEGGTQESPLVVDDSSDIHIQDVSGDDENDASVLSATQPATPVPCMTVNTNVTPHLQQEERKLEQGIKCQEKENSDNEGETTALVMDVVRTEDVVASERMSISEDCPLDTVDRSPPLDVAGEDASLHVAGEDFLLDFVNYDSLFGVADDDLILVVAGEDRPSNVADEQPPLDLDIFKSRAEKLIDELVVYPRTLNVERKEKEVSKATKLSRDFKKTATEAENKLYSDKVQSQLETIESKFQQEYQELLDSLQNQYASYTAALQYKYKEEAMKALENAVTG